jgi:type IV pilus assembly protein PilP
MKASLDLRAIAMLGLSVVALAGCGADMDELDSYINEIKSRPGGRIEPLPEITPYAVFTYTADVGGVRSPFVPDTPQVAQNTDSTRPDENRVKEHLESFSLDTLRMVGTMDMAGTEYGLVQSSDGLVHRVVPGNYMGQNDGRITEITDSEIKLVEIISDGIGGYVERDAAVGLSD